MALASQSTQLHTLRLHIIAHRQIAFPTDYNHILTDEERFLWWCISGSPALGTSHRQKLARTAPNVIAGRIQLQSLPSRGLWTRSAALRLPCVCGRAGGEDHECRSQLPQAGSPGARTLAHDGMVLARSRPDEQQFIRLGCILQVLCRKAREDACHLCFMARVIVRARHVERSQ